MQENNFEKRVQEQMEELRFRPSPAVWQKVEEEIKKRKKRRVVFFLSLLAGLCLLGYTGYFLFTSLTPTSHDTAALPTKESALKQADDVEPSQKERRSAAEAATDTEQDKGSPGTGMAPDMVDTAGDHNTISNEQQPQSFPNRNSRNPNTSSIAENAIDKPSQPIKESNPSGQLPLEAKQKAGQKPRNLKSRNDEKKLQVQAGNELIGVQAPVNTNTDAPDNRPFVSGSPKNERNDISAMKGTAAKQAEDLEAETAKNSDAHSDSVNKQNDTPVDLANAQSPVTPAKTKTSRLEFGLELSYGISGDRENAFPVGATQKSLADQMNNAPPVNFGTPAPSAIYYLPPASIKSGNAFRAGVITSFRLSRQSKISSGVRYAYFSHQLTMGGYKDTSVSFSNAYLQNVSPSAIYRGYEQRSFVNRFHFIQLPLQYELQVNKGRKVPITWNLGLSAGYLFSTNALVYDSAGHGRYVHNKKAFNKLQWNLNTGFAFRFGIRNKIQWSVGPELSLGMNKLMKEGYTPKQYLIYGGITGRIFLTKKK